MTTEVTIATQIPTIHLTEGDEEDAEEAEGKTGDATHLLVTDAGIAVTATGGMIDTETETGEEEVAKTEDVEVLLLEETEMTTDGETIDAMTDDTEKTHRMTTGEGAVAKIALRITDKRMTTQKRVGIFKVLEKTDVCEFGFKL